MTNSPDNPPSPRASGEPGPWYLFSPLTDLVAFAGSGLVTIGGIALASHLGLLDQNLPGWLWVFAIVIMDGGHVFGTLFRVYLDPAELRRRPFLYGLTPLVCFVIGFIAWQIGPKAYFRLIAYTAIFHFVRQQFGWVRLYRFRRGERDKLGGLLDELTIYAATLYPLLYLHIHPDQRWGWNLRTDLVQLPNILPPFTVIYWTLMAAYTLKSLYAWSGRAITNPGKDIVVATTAFSWYLGFVTYYESPFAHTLCVVVVHAMPYYALTYSYTKHRRKAGHTVGGRFSNGLVSFLITHALLGFLLSDVTRLVRGTKALSFFGMGAWVRPPEILWILVPLFATVQLTHYSLDAFIWRKKDNPDLKVFGH